MSLVNSFLDYLRGSKPKSASVAKERLQLILAHETARGGMPDYLPAMRQEILGVIAKYIDIDPESIKMNIDRQYGIELLELNIALPETDKRAPERRLARATS